MENRDFDPRDVMDVPRPPEIDNTGHTLSSRSLLLRKMATLMLLDEASDEEQVPAEK